MVTTSSFKFLGYGARVCNLPGTCRYSAMLLNDWTSQWKFVNPMLVVGGGVGRDTIHNMRTVQKRHSAIDRIRELMRDTDPYTAHQIAGMTEFGVKQIKRTVWRGGTYFGVCNGAYIAGKHVEYDDYSGNRINHGGLGLFPGTTFGPVFPGMVDGNSIASSGFPVEVVDVYGQPHTMWYHNGGTFPLTGGKRTGYRVHAMYDTEEDYPAVVSFRYGSGTVILSGIHPEFDGEGMDETSYQLFDGIFRKLGVVVR
jgi:hypothetical protein